MCLYTTLREPLIAEEDIICYKFYIRDNSDGTLYSPYLLKQSPQIGVKATTILDYPLNLTLDLRAVHKGFHSFATLEDIKSKIKDWAVKYYYRNDIKIIKCIIPKGSKYYTGTFSKCKAYCSQSIKLIEECV